MAYGVQLFDASGNELTGRSISAFAAAFISSPASGTRVFPVIEGKTLVAEPQRLSSPLNPDLLGTTTTVADNKAVTWSGASTGQPVIILYKRTNMD